MPGNSSYTGCHGAERGLRGHDNAGCLVHRTWQRGQVYGTPRCDNICTFGFVFGLYSLPRLSEGVVHEIGSSAYESLMRRSGILFLYTLVSVLTYLIND